MLNLHFIGHPFIDIGLSVATLHARKERPDQLTVEDLERLAQALKRLYSEFKGVQKYLSVILTNARFVQAANTVEQKYEYADNLLFLFMQDEFVAENQTPCTFFPELSARMDAARQHIPLLNGESIGHFSGLGKPGLPVSGLAMLLIHAMPLGLLRCGHFLGFHHLPASDQFDLNVTLTRRAFEYFQVAINLISPDEGDIPSYGSYFRTRYIDELLKTRKEILRHRQVRNQRTLLNNVSGYYFTNYGPSPNIEIIKLSNNVYEFLDRAQQDAVDAWNRLTAHNWVRPKDQQEAPDTDENRRQWRNAVYELLFSLPEANLRFARLIMEHGSWNLLVIFLQEIVRMQPKEIENLKVIGEALAKYMIEFDITSNGTLSWGMFHKWKRARGSSTIRQIIFSVNEDLSRRGHESFVALDQYLMAFERPGTDFFLARDIVAMVLFETLHQHGYSMNGAAPDDEQDETYTDIIEDVEEL